MLGASNLDELLAERERVNQRLHEIIDRATDPWGIKVTGVEVKHVELPEGMQRAIAKQAEAERMRRAKIILAEGEYQAAQKLKEAGEILKADPIALRYLETLAETAKEKNTTVVMTGVQDIVSDSKDIYLIDNGHKMMGSIVGTGCMAASVICSFAAVEKDYAFAATSALVCFGIVGELAAKSSKGPGTYKEAFYDEAFSLNREKIIELQKYRRL